MGKISLLLFMALAAVGAALATDSAPPDRATQEAKNKAIAGRVF